MDELTFEQKMEALRMWDQAVEFELLDTCPICEKEYKRNPYNKVRQNTCGNRRCVYAYYDRVKRAK